MKSLLCMNAFSEIIELNLVTATFVVFIILLEFGAKKYALTFYNDREVRAVWDEDNSKWWFSVLDIVGVLNGQDDYQKNRNYWKYLKTKLKKENNELVSVTNQLKLSAPDGKRRLTDVLDNDGVIQLAKNFSNTKT